MERLILDTGRVVALERGHQDRPGLLANVAGVAISAISAPELLVGVELADADHREQRREMVEGIIDRVEIIGFRPLS